MKTINLNFDCDLDAKFTREMVSEFPCLVNIFPKSKFPDMTLKEAIILQLANELQEGYDKVGIGGWFKIDPNSIHFNCPTEDLEALEKEWANRA